MIGRRLRVKRDQRQRHPRYIVQIPSHRSPDEHDIMRGAVARFLNVPQRAVAITDMPLVITEIRP